MPPTKRLFSIESHSLDSPRIWLIIGKQMGQLTPVIENDDAGIENDIFTLGRVMGARNCRLEIVGLEPMMIYERL